MKNLAITLALTSTVLMGCAAAEAMDSATLLQNPARYRVIGTQADGIVYVDTESIQSMQTRDFPNSIENISCTLYFEKYNSQLDAMAFQQNNLIRQINEYSAVLHGNKRDNAYGLTAELQHVYDPDGTAREIGIDMIQFQHIRDMFITAHRLASLPK